MRDGTQNIYPLELELATFSQKIGVHSIYSREFEATAFTRERWSPLHIFMRDGVNSILSCILFTLERRSPQHLHIIDVTVALLLFPVAHTQHLLRSDGFHNIFSREMTYMTSTHERWNPQHLFLVDGLHSIYS